MWFELLQEIESHPPLSALHLLRAGIFSLLARQTAATNILKVSPFLHLLQVDL